MTRPLTYAIIPTANRPDVCMGAISSLHHQVDELYVLDNGDEVPMPHDTMHAWPHWYVERYEDERPVNLSKVWNRGIELVEKQMDGRDLPFNIVIANDDAIFPHHWVQAVSDNMRQQEAAAGCSGPHDVVLHQPGPVPLSMRMQGWAFMLAGEKHLRVDEQFVWWFGDSDLDWQARKAGGMAMVSGFTVDNRFANQSTHGVRAVQSQQDGERFFAKWGLRAW